MKGTLPRLKQRAVVASIPIGGEVAILDMVSQPLDTFDHAGAVDAQILGIPIALIVFTEDIAAKGSEQWIDIIGCTGDPHDVIHFAFLLQGLAHGDHFIPGGGRGLDQVGIVEEAKVFRGIGHAVQNAVEGAGVQCFLIEIFCLITEIHRSQ